jgi:hypothetical protein
MSEFTIFSIREEKAIGSASYDPDNKNITISELKIPSDIPSSKKKYKNLTAAFQKGLVAVVDADGDHVLTANCIPPGTPFGGYATFKISALDGLEFATGNFRVM